MRDEINEPLRKAAASSVPGWSRGKVNLAAFAIGVFALCLSSAWWLETDPFKAGGPMAVVGIQSEKSPAPNPKPELGSASGSAAGITAEQSEKASGVKVTRGGGGGPSGALIIDVPQALALRLAPAPDPRLVEKSKFGDLPRTGADGARPADVYARPAFGGAKLRGAPQVALVVGGMGLDGVITRAAIARLPSAVSLGFAPYGDDLKSLAASAREAGHEILLQAPMEGFGETTREQRTLKSSASESENREALQWMMSRFPGFIGIENYLGAKLTSDTSSFAPVLAEIGSRGLIYLDDGSSPRSLTASLAQGLNLRAEKADVIIDASPSPEQIEMALAKLETLARRQGGAIGVATALPVSLEHVARWAEALEGRGIALVPVSGMIGRNSIRSADVSH